MNSDLQKALEAAAKREEDRVAAEILDTQIKIVTASYNQTTAYTNIILLGGYAGFFGLWQLTKEYLSKGEALWSALLVLISLLLFILFEVFKMVVLTKATMAKAKVLQSPEAISTPTHALAALQKLEASFEHSIGPFMRLWAATVVVCLFTAVTAALILAYAFIKGLVAST